MLSLKLLIAWYIWFQTTSSLFLSPSILLALANIQNQKAKAALNALNWHTKNQYNLALAKTRAKLPTPGNFNLPTTFGNSRLLPTFGSPNNLLPLTRNPLLVRTVRETVRDVDVRPVAEKVFLGGDDFGDVGEMDMLVPVQTGEVSSGKSFDAVDGSPGAARISKHFHLHKHLPHHHDKDIHIDHHVHVQSNHHSENHLLPPPKHHPQVIVDDNHLHTIPSHPLSYHPVQQMGLGGGVHDHGGHFRKEVLHGGHEGNLVDFGHGGDGQGHFGKGVLEHGEHRRVLVEFEHEKHRGFGRNSGVEDEIVGDPNLLQSGSPDSPPYQDPHFFDPDQPENRQAIVKFIQDEKQNMDRIIQSLNEKNYRYNAPKYSWEPTNEDNHYGGGDYTVSRASEGGPPGGERIGAGLSQFPMALPDELHRVMGEPRDAESRQEIISDYLETEQKNVQLAMEELQKAHERNVEILLKNLNEDFQAPPGSTGGIPLGSINSNLETPPILGHIIQVPNRRYSEEYIRRRPRSTEATRGLNEALNIHRDFLSSVKKHEGDDEDLEMVKRIGESVLDDIQNRFGKHRGKRSNKRVDVVRLVTDPNNKFDMPKTLENLGAVARTAFEDDHAPMYHLRNMMGSTRDAVMAAMKIPNQQFLIPTHYEIANVGDGGYVGDINPSLFTTPSTSARSAQPDKMVDGVMDTFLKVGSVIRGSVESGKEALSHFGAAANHAKSAVESTKHAVPKVLFKAVPNLLQQSRKKTMILTPRIFDFAKEDQQGSGGQQDFVRAGDILDAVGMSDSHPNLKFEKIIIEPRHNFLEDEEEEISSSGTQSLFDKIEVEDVDDVEHDPDVVGSTLDSLELVKQSFGSNSLKDFISRMKREFEALMRTAREKTLGGISVLNNNYNRKRANENNNAPPISNRFPTNPTTPTSKDGSLGYSFIPMDLQHPFMDQSETNPPQLPSMRSSNSKTRAAPIVGSINPLMYERIFNERLQKNKSPKNLEREIEGVTQGAGNDERPVSTSMKVQGQFLKPFMGQATKKNRKDFFEMYNKNVDKSKGDADFDGENYQNGEGDQDYDFIELQSVEE